MLNTQCLQKNGNMKIKREIDEKTNLYSGCVDCGFQKFETIDKEELRYLLKSLI